jgi:NADH-ubiquinone oxidoreductase chain 2
MSVSIILLIKKASITKLNEITSCRERTPTKIILIFNILSLAGLPPFLGFLAKLSVLVFFVSLNLKILIVLFVIMSLVSLCYYARTTYSSIITKQATKKIRQQNQSTPNISLTVCATLNILSPLIVTPI